MPKTIYLQPEDNSAKAIGRILKAKSKTINLVIPEGSKIFDSNELSALHKKLTDQKISTEITSNDNSGLDKAKSAGFQTKSTNPVSKNPTTGAIKIIYKKGKSPKKAVHHHLSHKEPDKKIEKPVENKTKPSFISQLLFGFLTILSIVVIISVFLLVIPTTNIRITTQVDSIPVDYSISLDTKQKNIDFINNIIPAQTITIEEESSQEARATGETNEGTRAGGTITVYNQSQSELPLVGNTRFLSSNGVLFRSNSSVTVPAGGSASVGVTADVAGADGNIGASKFTLPALPGSESYVYGQSSSSMSGGSDIVIYSVSDADINYSTDEIRKSLYNKAITDLTNKLPKGRKYLAQDMAQIEINTSTTAKPGDKVDTFNINAKTAVTFIVYDEKDINELTTNNLSKQISKERVFVSTGIDKLTTTIKDFNIKDGKATMNIKTTALSAPLYNTDVIKNKLTGKSKEQVKEYFLQFPEIQQIDIEFWPDWVNRVSKIPSRINIEINW